MANVGTTFLDSLLTKYRAPAQHKKEPRMPSTRLDEFQYLKAMKLGETEVFDNSEPSNESPSNRPVYKRFGYVLQELNKQLGRKELAMRGSGNTITIYRESDNGNTVLIPPPNPPSVRRSPQKKKIAGIDDAVKSYIDAQVAKMIPAVGKEYWLLEGTTLYFDNEEPALAVADALQCAVIHVRAV